MKKSRKQTFMKIVSIITFVAVFLNGMYLGNWTNSMIIYLAIPLASCFWDLLVKEEKTEEVEL